jgi:hypothetical protein
VIYVHSSSRQALLSAGQGGHGARLGWPRAYVMQAGGPVCWLCSVLLQRRPRLRMLCACLTGADYRTKYYAPSDFKALLRCSGRCSCGCCRVDAAQPMSLDLASSVAMTSMLARVRPSRSATAQISAACHLASRRFRRPSQRPDQASMSMVPGPCLK